MHSTRGTADAAPAPLSAPTIRELGDRGLLLQFGTAIDVEVTARVLTAWRTLAQARLPGVIDLVPAYAGLGVLYDWQQLPPAGRERPWHWLANEVCRVLDATVDAVPKPSRLVELPVCYEGEHAPDLTSAAQALGLRTNELIERHGAPQYLVAFLGFRPGFPYLLGLDPALSLPRLETPRARVEAGSVGIGGTQTGIYPAAGPGGWHLIGRTPVPLFDPSGNSPALLAPGDRLRFVAIDAASFDRLHRPTPAAASALRPGEPALFEVLNPGIHSSPQDPGRPGWRHLGIGAGGASDPIAARLANALVGNPADAAVVEMTLRGPDLKVLRPLTLALAGSGMEAFADDQALPFGRPITLAAGIRLHFHATGLGARAWLAVAGGLAMNRWLGSAATDFGSGAFGAALASGDRLAQAETDRPVASDAEHPVRLAAWWIDARAQIDAPMILRYIVDDEAEPNWRAELPARVWRVGLAADRTGLRLEGTALTRASQSQRLSSAVLYGTVQVPADGQPIVLGPDGQTTGGYPVAGHVIEADLPRLAQLKPGDLVWLQPTSLTEAHQARSVQAALVARSELAIRLRLSRESGRL